MGAIVTPRMTPKFRRELAMYLTLRYARDLKLVFRKSSKDARVEIAAAESADQNDLVWSPRCSLTALLHEIGHHRLSGHTTPLKGLEEIVEEARAWVWAEWCAMEEGVWFNYRLAEEKFSTYLKAYTKDTGREVPLKIQWRREW